MRKTMNQIDYECKVGERIFWKNLQDEKFEGVIKSWRKDEESVDIAAVITDEGEEIEIKC